MNLSVFSIISTPFANLGIACAACSNFGAMSFFNTKSSGIVSSFSVPSKSINFALAF